MSQGPTWQEQYELGVRYLSEGNYEEAILAFTAAIEIDPKRAPAYVGRGDAYVLSGETEENLAVARADYETAIELDETLAEAYLGLADVYIRQGEYEKALEVLQTGVQKVENSKMISDKIAEMQNTLEMSTKDTLLFSQCGITDFVSEEEYTIGGIPFYELTIDEARNLLPQFDEDEFWEFDGRKIYDVRCIEGNKHYVVIQCEQLLSNPTLDYVKYANFSGITPDISTEIRGVSLGNSMKDVLEKIGIPFPVSNSIVESGLSITVGADHTTADGYGWLRLDENISSSDDKNRRTINILIDHGLCTMRFAEGQLESLTLHPYGR